MDFTSNTLNLNSKIFSISGLAIGVYVIKIDSNDKSQTEKLIIQ